MRDEVHGMQVSPKRQKNSGTRAASENRVGSLGDAEWSKL